MNTRLQTAIVIAALGVSATGLSTKADACSISGYNVPSSLHWSLPHTLSNSVEAAVVEASAASGASPAANSAVASAVNPLQLLEPITGLWQFTFTAKNGAPVDAGFVTWHADGTEIMNSGKPPPTSNFCMGVYRHTSVYGYKLNHYALGWDATGTVFLGPASIREQIQLDRGGNTYSGTFSITQFAQDGTTVTQYVAGTVAAKRLTPDTN
ncbi:hypothetical protein GCM10008098_10230 [Rhodanobacter panaciterrae]|uniref:Uncharacterized protein n=1 Tax=Rhodanobacter panaciterrae TaxID=490572 RepID=A0ABQ2ZP19_9GAMM|nr:hypothetical protein [Rhodanobacter panaciterrae]GGY19798.1 hypothetical protein GCM10008098_10230 [Rhodanobacter panaciterrae]